MPSPDCRPGYRRLAYLGPDDERQPEAIGRAFAEAVTDQGHEAMVDHLNDNVSGADYWTGLREHLDGFLDRLKLPVGVLTAKAWITRFLAPRCMAHGWRPAETLSIVSMEDVKDVLELAKRLLRDQHMPVYQVARRAGFGSR